MFHVEHLTLGIRTAHLFHVEHLTQEPAPPDTCRVDPSVLTSPTLAPSIGVPVLRCFTWNTSHPRDSGPEFPAPPGHPPVFHLERSAGTRTPDTFHVEHLTSGSAPPTGSTWNT
jgi:hypothetical protein